MAADVFLVSMFDYLADSLAAFLYVYARRRTVKVDLKSVHVVINSRRTATLRGDGCDSRRFRMVYHNTVEYH